MDIRKMMVLGTLCLAAAGSLFANDDATEIVVRKPSGESIVLEVLPDEPFSDVILRLENEFVGIDMDEGDTVEQSMQSLRKREYVIDYMSGAPEIMLIAKKGSTGARNYNAPVSSKEKGEIAYIVNTLARESLRKLPSLKSSLKKAGDKVEHIHPLRFLMTIFSDNELKASAAQIQGRSFVWKEFSDNVVSSLDKESKAGNLKPEYIADFANKVGINVGVIESPLREKRWKDFIVTLIKNVPRNGDPNRYDQ